MSTNVERWDAAHIRNEWQERVASVVGGAIMHQSRYEAVARETHVPWEVIAAIHNMESSQDFTAHLHEGSSLNGRTRFVPKGRPIAPPKSGHFPYTWEESAKDALEYDGLVHVDWEDVEASLNAIENYNGAGYRRYHPSVPTPYLWSGTNLYGPPIGKYGDDGKWDKNAVSKQVGVCAFLIGIRANLWK